MKDLQGQRILRREHPVISFEENPEKYERSVKKFRAEFLLQFISPFSQSNGRTTVC
jgi:hypothetical protein